MNEEAIQGLPDDRLALVLGWAQAEISARQQKRRNEAIATIRALAATAGVSVAINGHHRGRPPKQRSTGKPLETGRRPNH
jgi:hypothetical protein